MFESDDWVISTAATDAGNLIIRSRSEIPSPDLRADHKSLVIITWPFEGSPAGMPDQETYDVMIGMEDALFDALSDDWGVEVASITGGGQKEWRFYTPDPDTFAARFSQSLASHPAYPIELAAFEDSDWQCLAELIPSIER